MRQGAVNGLIENFLNMLEQMIRNREQEIGVHQA
jgi:hypothetical protein